MVGNPQPDILYDGTEGELYDVDDDPHQWRNLWSDPQFAKLRRTSIDDLYGHMPPPVSRRSSRSADVGARELSRFSSAPLSRDVRGFCSRPGVSGKRTGFEP